jgi:hypothetical protein
VVYPGEITPQLMAFADAARQSEWPWIEDRQQIAAWSGFLAANVLSSRGQLVVTRGTGDGMRRGIYAPWPWPPRKDGTRSEGPPPDVLANNEDLDALASEGQR